MRRGLYLMAASLGVAVIVVSACIPPPPADVETELATFEIDASQVEYGPFPPAIPFVTFSGQFVSGRQYAVQVDCDGSSQATAFDWFDHDEREVYFEELDVAVDNEDDDPHCRITEGSTQGGVIVAFECAPPNAGRCWIDNGGLEVDTRRNRTIHVVISNTFAPPPTPTTTIG